MDSIEEEKLQDNDFYEEITDLEREIMSYLDKTDIKRVKPEERKHSYFTKNTRSFLLPIKKSRMFLRRNKIKA